MSYWITLSINQDAITLVDIYKAFDMFSKHYENVGAKTAASTNVFVDFDM